MATREPQPPPHLMRMALRVAKIRGRSKMQHALVLADAMDEANWPDSSIPTGRRGRQRYEVISLDVWGNARDGFEINNLYRTGTVISVPMEEKLHNVRWFRDSILDPKRKATVHSLWSDFTLVPGALERVLRREVLHENFRGRIVIEDIGDDALEISGPRGRPLLHLAPVVRRGT